jgi:hypothetical protein
MSAGFSYDEKKNRFTWPLSQIYGFPLGIEIHFSHTLEAST